ncbi:hypothetical protein [Listeria seeligeri]|uniref:hypothetical protein n=1 Tax=Listeria seeligeri TaxID=1640 RepID=UPI00188773FA|nr:hypothetical protein [Listeria seeligeri]MBF2662569.1 hypothetical protein [Listeria seeligeri]
MDPYTGKVAEFFDVTGMNWIHSDAWNSITKTLLAKEYEDAILNDFVQTICQWIIQKQKEADEIIIEGTL